MPHHGGKLNEHPASLGNFYWIAKEDRYAKKGETVCIHCPHKSELCHHGEACLPWCPSQEAEGGEIDAVGW